MPDPTPQEIIDRAAAIRYTGLTAEHRARRELLEKRNKGISEGVKRGPLAHSDGTFGKLKGKE